MHLGIEKSARWLVLIIKSCRFRKFCFPRFRSNFFFWCAVPLSFEFASRRAPRRPRLWPFACAFETPCLTIVESFRAVGCYCDRLFFSSIVDRQTYSILRPRFYFRYLCAVPVLIFWAHERVWCAVCGARCAVCELLAVGARPIIYWSLERNGLIASTSKTTTHVLAMVTTKRQLRGLYDTRAWLSVWPGRLCNSENADKVAPCLVVDSY